MQTYALSSDEKLEIACDYLRGFADDEQRRYALAQPKYDELRKLAKEAFTPTKEQRIAQATQPAPDLNEIRCIELCLFDNTKTASDRKRERFAISYKAYRNRDDTTVELDFKKEPPASQMSALMWENKKAAAKVRQLQKAGSISRETLDWAIWMIDNRQMSHFGICAVKPFGGGTIYIQKHMIAATISDDGDVSIAEVFTDFAAIALRIEATWDSCDSAKRPLKENAHRHMRLAYETDDDLMARDWPLAEPTYVDYAQTER